MVARPLRILQVGALETGGGAASVAGNLLRSYQARGCEAWMAVGKRATDDPSVFVLPDDDRLVYRLTGYTALRRSLGRIAGRSLGSGWGSLSRTVRLATHPRAVADQARGTEDFEFPGTYSLLDLPPVGPDIVHCHNLHGGYFDLRALAWLSQRVPTVLTLHDAWLLSGHCAHSFDCERWTTGCGECPDLTIYPSIRRDASSTNWLRKRDIYKDSRLYVTAPSRWLMGKIERSILAPAMQLGRVIPNGVNRSIFRPADKQSARRDLGIDTDAAVVLLTLGGRDSPWIDHETLRSVIPLIGAQRPRSRLIVVVVGDEAATLRAAGADVRAAAYQADPKSLARYYQAADVFLHCARTGTFPSTILEALACGTPVVASDVGGIPEQIRSAAVEAMDNTARATGQLVPAGNAGAMADAVIALLDHAAVREHLGRNAVDDVRDRFDLNRQVECYLAWYRTIIEHWTQHVRSDFRSTPAAAAGPIRMAVD